MNATEIEQEITEEEYRGVLNELYPEVEIGSVS